MKGNADDEKSFARRKVALVVGSDEAVAGIVHKVLPSWKVVRVDKNSSALEMLREKPYDLVLTGDETTSEEDVELLRQIRIARPHTRMIILTKRSTPADAIAAMRERAFSYFSEPYSMTDFTQMLELATTGPVWDEGIEVLAATPEWIRLLARCDVKTANRLLQFIHEIAVLPEQERAAVGAAFREVLMNAIEHGARFDSSQHVEIAYLRTKYAVACRVKDPGEGFSLEELRHAAIANPPDAPLFHLEERKKQGLRPGGFGILLAKHIVDELIYGESGNDVILIKYLDGRRHSPDREDSQAKDPAT
jgi:anti-sigma regulatory factor (Ser/Thr protein kinase)/ActR/RegA family two-component response regulator